MNAFVKTTNGEFPNPNFYLAWKGLTDLQFNVIKFEEKDLEDPKFWMSCTRSTPVFAGVHTFKCIMEKLGVNYKEIDTYPIGLRSFMLRGFTETTLGQVRKDWETYTRKKFIKPIEHKKFTGFVIHGLLDWLPIRMVPDETPVYLVDEKKFISEYRVFIRDGRILVGKHYRGDWARPIDMEVVKQAIDVWGSNAPCAYALDFGLLENGETALVEYNDATSLGSYGMDGRQYADMIVSRWFEICG